MQSPSMARLQILRAQQTTCWNKLNMPLAKRKPASAPSKQVKEIQGKHILGLSKSSDYSFNSLWQKVKAIEERSNYRQKSWLKTRKPWWDLIVNFPLQRRVNSGTDLAALLAIILFNIFTDLDRSAQWNPPSLQIKLSFFRSASCNGSNYELWKALTKLSK